MCAKRLLILHANIRMDILMTMIFTLHIDSYLLHGKDTTKYSMSLRMRKIPILD